MNPFAVRRAFFDEYPETNTSSPGKYGVRSTCPCCGYPTLHGRNGFEICYLCSWEDDGQDDVDAEENHGGPNHGYSLSHARSNFDLHISMYDPGNNPTISGEDTPDERSQKQRAIDAFESMIADPAGEHKPFWHEVLSAERKLYELLKLAIRRYEQRA